MVAYYNERDPYAAQWLRNLIAEELIAPGEVDERDILDVVPSDLAGFQQCHFFAGIGGWSLALRMAGWPDDRPVWSGSCPCQPFSAAGAGKGFDDERHLFPAFRWLIDQRRPATVFGEQVASKLGREWLAGVRADLEALGYATGGGDLCAAGVGAPHIRQRLFWVADSKNANGWRELPAGGPECGRSGFAGGGGLGDAFQSRLEGYAGHVNNGNEPGRQSADEARPTAEASSTGRLANPDGGNACPEREQSGGRSPVGGRFWSDAAWIPCADGKARRIEPGVEPLAHGIPARVGKLRAYGNAIVPQVATGFVMAFMEAELRQERAA